MPEKIIIEAAPVQDPEVKKKADKKKEEELKKLAQPKPLFYYDVKVECLLPATLTYRILAEDAQQAVEKLRGAQPNSVQHRLIGRRELKLTVYDAGSTIIKFLKRLAG